MRHATQDESYGVIDPRMLWRGLLMRRRAFKSSSTAQTRHCPTETNRPLTKNRVSSRLVRLQQKLEKNGKPRNVVSTKQQQRGIVSGLDCYAAAPLRRSRSAEHGARSCARSMIGTSRSGSSLFIT